MDIKRTGALISELRKRKNMTQKELADRLGVTDKAVSKWERGVSPKLRKSPPTHAYLSCGKTARRADNRNTVYTVLFVY